MAARRILIVDDHTDSAESLAMLLSMDGHDVMTVPDGEAAFLACESFQPDVIVIDIGLPDMTGYDVARHLRKIGCTARLIALTGYGQRDDIQRARSAGFDHHCLKPAEPTTLNQLIN